MIVDVHCHFFNGDDLPVRGFVRKVGLHSGFGSGLISILLDLIAQGSAPGYDEDMGRLNALLAPANGLETVAVEAPTESLDAAADRLLAALQVQGPQVLGQLSAEMDAYDGVPPAAGLEGFSIGSVKRAIRWVALYGRSRIALAGDYAESTGGEIGLCTPMLVDLEIGLADKAKTTVRQQLELFEKLSRASMLGVLPRVGGLQIHPFVGFDPLRELRARHNQAVERPLDVVKDAINRYGFVGVKVYPQMGWRPSGNQARPGLSAADAATLDQIVDELAAWCDEEQVPITAHCNDSNYADDDEFGGFGAPEQWLTVLTKHRGLHLNLGHFGGAHDQPGAYGAARAIAAGMTDTYPALHADVGCHRIDQPAVLAGEIAELRRLADQSTTREVGNRLMFGTDWYMLAINPKADDFLNTYRDAYTKEFGAPSTEQFLASNALRFLGFSDPTNKNRLRLLARYRRWAPDCVPLWLEDVAP